MTLNNLAIAIILTGVAAIVVAMCWLMLTTS
jgi:hypothetical protein